MQINPFLSDETTITPPSPAAALFRSWQIEGKIGAPNPKAKIVPELAQELASSREALQEAISHGEKLGTAFSNLQKSIQKIYAHILEMPVEPQERSELMKSLGFPDLERTEQTWVQMVDISKVVATHFKPKKQVFTTLAFEEAHGATAYWLHEIRVVDGEDIVDAVVENWAPQFSRVRMPVGKHRLIIESRNSAYAVMSPEFEIEVPQL